MSDPLRRDPVDKAQNEFIILRSFKHTVQSAGFFRQTPSHHQKMADIIV